MAFGAPWSMGANAQAYDSVGNYQDYTPDSAKSAALCLAMMVATAAIFLTVLKRSGFRAMVAVGRG